ncbi:MAG: D-alanine--D-serine ligase VanG [Clostridiales bacterium]|nr:D-alanine--D-serine ligase VanG [Clostridiales bacterium]
MNKIKIAVLFGGFSPEYSVSLQSAYSVISNLNRSKYDPILIGISNTGQWYYYTGDIEKIKEDHWQNAENCIPAVLSPNRNTGKLLLLKKSGIEALPIDAAFPIMHGKFGEDGTLQGLIEMAGIPLIGCGTLASALCMDKARAHKLAQLAGIEVPKSVVLQHRTDSDIISKFAKEVGFPLFIKPVKAGSSYGITKVQHAKDLNAAISLAFRYDNEIIAEENINGFEVGCAIMGNTHPIAGEVDEIELLNGFFDFTEKYTLKTSSIHVPARISKKNADRIKNAAITLYQALGCSGFARVDMFLTSNDRIVFNEINTIPGFTEHSRYPAMMKAAGLSFSEMLDKIIESAVKECIY